MKKILIIDDDAIIGKILQLKIQHAVMQNGIDAEVLRVFDGEEGMEAIAKNTPDLIVLDLMMPKKSGFEVLEGMQGSGSPKNKTPHIMVLTNLSGDDNKNKVAQLGASAYFIKSGTSIEQIAQYVCKQLAS